MLEKANSFFASINKESKYGCDEKSQPYLLKHIICTIFISRTVIGEPLPPFLQGEWLFDIC